MLCSCNCHRGQETTDNISEDILPREDSVESLENESMTYIEDSDNGPFKRIMAKADTVYLKNGIRAVQISGFAPQNECIILTDRKSRPIMVYSCASETDAQILVFSYAQGERINIVKESYLDIIALPETLESLFESIHKIDVAFEYIFIYNEEESITEIRRKVQKPDSNGSEVATEVIKASSGTHLEGDFRPVEDYWASDLRGGRLDMYCKEVSNTDTSKDTTLRKWINFQPVSNFDDSPAIPEEFFLMPKAIPFQ